MKTDSINLSCLNPGRRNQSVPEGRENLGAPSLPGLKYSATEQNEDKDPSPTLRNILQENTKRRTVTTWKTANAEDKKGADEKQVSKRYTSEQTELPGRPVTSSLILQDIWI